MDRRAYIFIVIVVLITMAAASCGKQNKPIVPDVPVSDNPAAEKQFRLAQDAFDAGQYKLADAHFAVFETAYFRDPLAPAATLYRGRIALAEGRLDQATEFLERLAGDKSSIHERAAFYLGVVYYRQKKYEEAVERLSRFARRLMDQGENRLLYNCLWRSARELERPLDVVMWTEAYIEASPSESESIEALTAGAEAIASIDDPKILSRLARKLSPEKEIWIKVMVRLARLYFEAGQLDDAAQIVAKVQEQGHGTHPVITEIDLLIQKRLTVDLYTVGCILPITGRARLVGEAVLKGVMLGADSVSLGADNRPLAVVSRDSLSDPQKAKEAVDELVQVENVSMIIGLVDSNAALAASEQAEKYGIPVIALSIRDDLTSVGEYIFRHFATNRAEVRALLFAFEQQMASEVAGGKKPVLRIASLYPANGYGRQMHQLLQEELNSTGGQLVASVAYSPDKTSFTDDAAKLAEIEFDALFIPDLDSRVGLIAPALATKGIWSGSLRESTTAETATDETTKKTIQLLIPSVGYKSDLGRRAGRYLEGALFSLRYFEQSSRGSEEFARRYRDRYAENASYFSAYGFDAAVIAASAMNSGARTRAQLKEWLLSSAAAHELQRPTAAPFDGFEPAGEPDSYPLVARMNGGVLEIVE